MCRSVVKMAYSLLLLLFFALLRLEWKQDPSSIFCHASTVASGRLRKRSATTGRRASEDPIAFLCKRQQQPSSLTIHKNNDDDNDERQLLPNDNNDESQKSIQQQLHQKSHLLVATTAATEKQEKKGSPFWPPWPFNLMMNQKRNTYEPTTTSSSQQQLQLEESSASNKRRTVSSSTSSFSAASLIWTFGYQTIRVSFKNMQELGSQLWFHLPPATPPFLLLASVPQRSSTITTKMILPIWSDPFVRNVMVSSLGLAIMSWAHSELTRRRKLTLLPLSSRYIDMNRVVLPPFLPEAVPTPFWNDIQQQEDDDDDDDDDEDADENSKQSRRNKRPVLPSRLQRHWKQLRGKVPKPRSLSSAIRDWKNMRLVQKSERKNAHRLLIYDELLAIQTLKKKADRRHEHHHHHHHQNKKSSQGSSFSSSQSSSGKTATETTKSSQHDTTNKLGYALVTGASQGIGRAIAVELARWEIPLILVARNVDALIELAYDIEACYGVPCCVLQADLAKPETAQAIYQTVKDAGLPVDILVNNAGVSSQGQSLLMSLDEINRMIQVNAISVSTLTHLFGRDMKERRRGRILMVSSICGAVSGIASVAVYSATKAFENSFGISIGKELEPYGVGVTCLLPGAVRGTEFRARSNSAEALCWKLPFYAKTAPFVAHMGVRAMLRGETEVTPGVMNRIFLKVIKPILPQRMHNLIAEIAWSPLAMPWEKKRDAGDWEDTHSVSSFVDEAQPTYKHVAKPVRPHAYGYRELPPRILKLPEPKPEPVPVQEVITEIVENNATVSMDTDEIGSNGSDVTIIEREPTVLPQNTISTLQSLPESPSVPTPQDIGGQDEIPKASSPVAPERVEEAEKPNIQRTRTQMNNDARETRKIPKRIREKPAKNDGQKSKQTQESTTADDSLKPVQRLEEILNRATSGSEFYAPSIHPTEKQGLICDRVTGICN